MSDEVTAITDVTAPPEVVASACLVVIYVRDGQPGKHFKLDDAPLCIGRDADNDIPLEDHGVSRRHARIERLRNRLVLVDLGSTNGTLLNGVELQGTAELVNGDEIKIGSTIFKYLSAANLEAALHEQIYQSLVIDHLTQLSNRRYLDDVLAREFSRSRRHGRSLSMLLMDIDHFKKVNDTYGHLVGDAALRATADAIRACVRSEDIVARFGGEEIVALLPETAIVQALVVAEKIRETVSQNPISFCDTRLTVTISIGCAEFDPADADAAAFLARCDAKMYQAKDHGRNCVRS